MTRICITLLTGTLIVSALLGAPSDRSDVSPPTPPAVSPAEVDVPPVGQAHQVGYPSFCSPHARPIVLSGGLVFVANTPADTVDVIDAQTRRLVARVNVGIDPVSLAIRPDGKELWVSNHVSDSVSVIDIDHDSPTHLNIVATIQDFDRERKSTRFDEPMGIAFASNDKAYVALSSENQIAVVNVASRRVIKRLTIPAQDPRAIAVRGDRLYVIPFESNNQTQLSGGAKDDIDGELVTFDAWNHSIANNNVLSIGHVVDIVKHPDVPDRDLFVFETTTDKLVETVDTLGTLLYGLTVDSLGNVYIAQTDARNDVNGRAGTKQHSLAELENRAFLNRITHVTFDGDTAEPPRFIDLEPLPPEHPRPGEALATPYAIEISGDDGTLVATAAASDQLFTVDAASGEILGRVGVDAVPRGIALQSNDDGHPARAWVLNAVANTVSLVNLSNRTTPKLISSIPLENPTHPAVKRGRIAFETASASTTGTYACASCHPDGHTDQLLWVLKTPVVTGGDQIMPRSTMPIRGLRDTEPYHWDGIPGDPYGGNNSANVHGSDPPNSRVDIPTTSTRHLIDGGLAATMAMVSDETVNDEGKPGRLSAQERDDMATFLLSVPYPPAQRRAYNNVVSERAKEGFRLFHIDGDNDPAKARPNVCGDCHRMPFLVSTNTPGTGMDAPTWRGAYDRFLILPQGRLNIIDFDFYERVAQRGIPEQRIWQFSWAGRERFDPVWDMVLEASTGFSGAFGRQCTVNASTVDAQQTRGLLDALETAALDGAIVLDARGVLDIKDEVQPTHLQFVSDADGGVYRETDDPGRSFTRDDLVRRVREGKAILTFTGRHGRHSDVEHPQPAIWTKGPIQAQRGHQEFPTLYPGQLAMTVSGRHLDEDARVFLDGRRIPGHVSLQEGEHVAVELQELPETGMHLLQLHNPDGQFTNDFILTVAQSEPEAAADEEKPRVLGDVLQRSGWDRLIGTWVDADTNGSGLKTSFRWKIEDRVLENESFDPARTSVALIGINAQNGDVFQVGADSTGSSHLGTWTVDKEGDAVLNLGYTRGDGSQGELTLRYSVIDNNTLDLTLQLPQPFTIRLKRAESPASRD